MYHRGDPMVVVNFRLMTTDRERVQALAARSRSTLSDWLRCLVQEALQREDDIDRRANYYLGETSEGEAK